MRKYFIIKTFILWNVKDSYCENIYKYETKEEQQKGYKKISEDLERLMRSETIANCRIEVY